MDHAYGEQRLKAIEALKAALLADDDDSYSKAYDRLITLEREAGEFDDYPPGVCSICYRTSEDGVVWANDDMTMCTDCENGQSAAQAGTGGGASAEVPALVDGAADQPGVGCATGPADADPE